MTIAEIIAQQAAVTKAQKEFTARKYAAIRGDANMEKPKPQDRVKAFFEDRQYDDIPEDKIARGNTVEDMMRVIAKEQPEEYPVMGKPVTRKTFSEMSQSDVVMQKNGVPASNVEYDRSLIMSAGSSEIEYVNPESIKKEVKKPSINMDSPHFAGVPTTGAEEMVASNRLLDAMRAMRQQNLSMMKD